MPKTGDAFTVSLGNAQLDWGEHRNPTNRAFIEGEGYIAIPKHYAREFGLFNSNYESTGLGFNEFRASSTDGFIDNVILLAQGCSKKGDPYAKNLAVKGSLKTIGAWFAYCGATSSNSVKVTFTSSTTVLLELI